MDPALDALARSASRKQGLIGLAGGLPAERHFPKRALAEAFTRAIMSPSASGCPLQYGWPEGQEPLRAQIAERLRARGVSVRADEVLITNGAQQALSLAIQTVCRRGDTIAADEVSYPSALSLFRARGLRLAPLGSATSAHAATKARLAYVMPAVANPTGRAMTRAERDDLLRHPELYILEDDAYAELRFTPSVERPLLAEAPDRVFHVGTFSKVLCPGLRIGWLVMPASFRTRLREQKEAADLQAGTLAQVVVSDYLAAHDFAARVSRLQRAYRRRAELLGEALTEHLPFARWRWPEGGFSFWVETDSTLEEARFLRAALQEGVSFDPGSLFRLEGNARPLSFRLCFSAAEPHELSEGCRRLARAWRRAHRRAPSLSKGAEHESVERSRTSLI